MSHTINHLKKLRLQRSELAVPGSSPEMIDKAANSAADFIFLDIEDAVAPPDKERARKNIIQALNDIDWRAKGKARKCIKLPNGEIRVRRDELDRWLASCEEVA